MRFRVIKSSEYVNRKSEYVNINSLEELLEFNDKCECKLIISREMDAEVDALIEIYDDYRE